jgi:hypothetical protein
MIKDKIINALPLEMQNAVDFNNIFSDSLFDDLETEYLQDKFIEENHVHPIKNICHFICVLNFFIQTTLNLIQ